MQFCLFIEIFKYSVRINRMNTDWFSANGGFRQGSSLSPLPFNIYINNLVLSIMALDVAIDINGQKVSILHYDDIVLISDKELQLVLDVLDIWCYVKRMTVNVDKSNLVHFRQGCGRRTRRIFKSGDFNFETVRQYMYLGLLLL